MADFLDNLAARSLNQTPVLEPRPVSRFEPWQPGGELGGAHLNFAMTPVADRAADRVETVQPWLPRESGMAPQSRFDQFQREAHGPPIEAPLISTLPAPLSREQSSAVTPQAVPPPAPRNAGAAIEPHTLPPANPLAQQTGRIEHVIVEHHEPNMGAQAVGPRSGGTAETFRASENALRVIERTERVIVERELSTQEREQAATIAKPLLNSLPTTIVKEPPFPRQVVETAGTGPDRVVQPSAAQLTDHAAPPLATTARSVMPTLVTPIVERVVRVKDDTERSRIDHSGAASRSHLNAVESRRSSPPLSMSAIHVTIGRIEVRAAPPPAPVKRASPPASTMTLEEYLRSRSGDRR